MDQGRGSAWLVVAGSTARPLVPSRGGYRRTSARAPVQPLATHHAAAPPIAALELVRGPPCSPLRPALGLPGFARGPCVVPPLRLPGLTRRDLSWRGRARTPTVRPPGQLQRSAPPTSRELRCLEIHASSEPSGEASTRTLGSASGLIAPGIELRGSRSCRPALVHSAARARASRSVRPRARGGTVGPSQPEPACPLPQREECRSLGECRPPTKPRTPRRISPASRSLENPRPPCASARPAGDLAPRYAGVRLSLLLSLSRFRPQ